MLGPHSPPFSTCCGSCPFLFSLGSSTPFGSRYDGVNCWSVLRQVLVGGKGDGRGKGPLGMTVAVGEWWVFVKFY